MGSRKTANPPYRALAVSLGFTVILLAGGAHLVQGLSADRLISRLVWPLLRLMCFITAGLAVGQVIEASGWTRTLAALAAPVFRFGNLGERCSAAFTTAFFSGVAANAMLMEFYEEGKISRRQLFLSNFVNQMPAYFLHLPTTFFIVIPLTRWAGALYFLLTFAAMMLRTALFLIYGHFQKRMTESAEALSAPDAPARKAAAGGVWAAVRRRLPRRVAGIAVYVLPIYTLVYLLNAMGLFDAARHWMARYVTTAFIPVESLSLVILSFAAEFTSGFAAAGALLDAGALTVKQTVLALLIGNVIAFPIRALRHQLPRYMGIFSPKTGLQLLLMGQGFRVLSLVLVGIFYYMVA